MPDHTEITSTQILTEHFAGGVANKSDKTPRGDVIPRGERTKGSPSQKVRSMVQLIANGMDRRNAVIASGLRPEDAPITSIDNAASEQFKRPFIRDMLAAEQAQTALDNKITRKNVLDGLKEAIDMARIQGEPGIMIAGWKEIGKMCGFYEAVKVKVDLTSGGARISTVIRTLSDDDLLRLAGGETIEGEVIGE